MIDYVGLYNFRLSIIRDNLRLSVDDIEDVNPYDSMPEVFCNNMMKILQEMSDKISRLENDIKRLEGLDD